MEIKEGVGRNAIQGALTSSSEEIFYFVPDEETELGTAG
jgi:hypothetical protein